jgi:hypothetical protein
VSALHGERYTRFFWNVLVFMMGVLGSPKFYFSSAHSTFDHGVLSLELSRGIERAGKHWVSELECSRHIHWQGQWRRVDTVAHALWQAHPASFRAVRVRCRNGQTKAFWVFTNQWF